jgi:hypothetical protein
LLHCFDFNIVAAGLLHSPQKRVRTEVFHAEGAGTGIAIADVSAWIAVTL